MKRIVSLLLVAICVLSCFVGSTTVAFAANKYKPPKVSFTYGQGGIWVSTNTSIGPSEYYRFYVKTSRNGSWERIGTTSDSEIRYATWNGGTTYYFTVRIVNARGGFLSDFNTYSCYYCNTPGSLNANQTSKGIRVTWDKCYGVTKYRVYWQASNGGWIAQGDVYGNSFVDTNPKKDWWNVYTVRGLDSDGDWCTSYKPNGCSCWQGGPNSTRATVNDIMRGIHNDDSDYRNPARYWSYSEIPAGADWCTGFANYVIGKSCGYWRFGGEWHRGAYWNSDYEDGEVYQYDSAGNKQWNYNSPACWHPLTDVWARWANNHGIFRWADEYEPEIGDVVFFINEGLSYDIDNISHVGIVYNAANNNTVWTVEGNTGGGEAYETHVNPYAYLLKNGRLRSSNRVGRYIAGYISMKDIYYRTAYDNE